MFLSKTVLVMCRLEICVNLGENQSPQDFRGWAEKRDMKILGRFLCQV